MASEETPTNSLGLDFDRLRINEPDAHTNAVVDAPPEESVAHDVASDAGPNQTEKEKKKPYINPERVKTGGVQRDKLSEEELAERMERIKQQNEKIKQRQMDVQADKDAFEKTQEAERIRQAQSRKVQEHVNRTREQNARRKMEKAQMREWDSGKSTGDWKQTKKPPTQEDQAGTRVDGGGRTGGPSHWGPSRGRGRARDT